MNKFLGLIAIVMITLLAWQFFGAAGTHGGRLTTISHGERVELTDFIEPQGRTIIQFTADWCPGCKQIAPHVEDLLDRDASLVIRKVDIESWNSPVAQQYEVRSIPHLLLYEDGRLVAQGVNDVFARMQ